MWVTIKLSTPREGDDKSQSFWSSQVGRYVSRPAKSSDKAEDLLLDLLLFGNLPLSRFILKLFRFFRTLLVIDI